MHNLHYMISVLYQVFYSKKQAFSNSVVLPAGAMWNIQKPLVILKHFSFVERSLYLINKMINLVKLSLQVQILALNLNFQIEKTPPNMKFGNWNSLECPQQFLPTRTIPICMTQNFKDSAIWNIYSWQKIWKVLQ